MGKPFILFRHHPLRPLRPLCPRISRGWTRNVHAKRPAYVRDRGLSVSLIRQSPGHGRDLSGVANHPGPRSVRASNVSAHSPRRVRSTGRRLSSASLLSVRAMSEPCPSRGRELAGGSVRAVHWKRPSQRRRISAQQASKFPVKYPATGRAAVAQRSSTRAVRDLVLSAFAVHPGTVHGRGQAKLLFRPRPSINLVRGFSTDRL